MENWSLSMDNWLFSKQPKWTIIYLFEVQNMCKNGYLIQKLLFT